MILVKRSYSIIRDNSNIRYQSILCAVLTIIIHSFLDFDLSFFYLLLVTFVAFGILTSFHQEEFRKKDTVKRNWMLKGMLIGMVTILMFINLKDFIVGIQMSQKITNRSSFEEKYEFYEKSNELLPYNKEFKIKKIKLIEAYQFKYPEKQIEYTEEILQNVEFLLKNEKYYNRFEMQARFVGNSINLLGMRKDEEMIKNIEEGYTLIKNNNVQRRYSAYAYLTRKSGIHEIAQTLMEKSNVIENEEEKAKLKELARGFYQLNIEEYEEDKSYLVKAVSNEKEREEYLEALLQYKEEALKMVS